jgi:5-methylcytosine-specific restriction protein A
MNEAQGVIDLDQNPFSTKSWIDQSFKLTAKRAAQLKELFGKSIDEIKTVGSNQGRYPAFVGIRWGYAEVREFTLQPTEKWDSKINSENLSLNKKNPSWTRDELILALELYFRVNPLHTSEKNSEIQKLSSVLNELPIHAIRPDGISFRNPNGVYMKLCNFLRFDPSYHGTGLSRGGMLEQAIWKEFANDKERLSATAQAIYESRRAVTQEQVESEVFSDDEEFSEGRLLTTLHKRRERNASAIKRKKESVLKRKGKLECELCGFDFEKAYGKLGSGFAECHHTIPLFQLNGLKPTRLNDLAILCANCHRMIHRTRPMLSISQFKNLILLRKH